MIDQWTPPRIPNDFAQGDMPGDKIKIVEPHIQKANVIFPELLERLGEIYRDNQCQRAVVAVCGGSGGGKTGTASILTYYLQQMGIGSYTMSGDNYPRRIPMYNDAERMRIFRHEGLKGLVSTGAYHDGIQKTLRTLQKSGEDADPAQCEKHPWLGFYQQSGRDQLSKYIGSPQEIDFDDIARVVSSFKRGDDRICLKRMGRAELDVWYEDVDFAHTHVLIIEWTHGNSGYYHGVDLPILLNSTPQETLAFRMARNRDGNTDSPFTTMVLEIEQNQLEEQAVNAKMIVTQDAEKITYEEYRAMMDHARKTFKKKEYDA